MYRIAVCFGIENPGEVQVTSTNSFRHLNFSLKLKDFALRLSVSAMLLVFQFRKNLLIKLVRFFF